MDFPFQEDDQKDARRPRGLLFLGIVAAFLIVIAIAIAIDLSFHRRDTPHAPDPVTVIYERPMKPEPVIFDVDGVKIGDSLEKAKTHFEPFEDGDARRKTGQLGSRTINVRDDDGTLNGRVILYFLFDDAPKVIAFGVNFPVWYYDAMVKSYTQKFGAEPYKSFFETYKTAKGEERIRKVVIWNTTDGDFILRSLNEDGAQGVGELCLSRWKAYRDKVYEAESQKEQNSIQKQLDGKL
jgi:hypothetical protein